MWSNTGKSKDNTFSLILIAKDEFWKCLRRKLHRQLEIYHKSYFLSLSIFLLSVAGINAFIDPYGIWFSPAIQGVNWSKPKKNLHQRLFKAFDIAHKKPTGLILGSSRALYGLSPKHPKLIQHQPVYNAALSSANMYELLRYFQHALHHQPDLKLVIIGLDFFAFNKNISNRLDFSESRLSRPLFFSKDALVTTLSWSVLLDSGETLSRNREKPDIQQFQEDGFALYHEYIEQPRESQHRLKAFERSIANHFRSADILASYDLSKVQLENLQRIVDICREQDIELQLFISPTHVTDLEAIYAAGLWPDFEEWKRKVVQITPVWDFSGYTLLNSEEINDQMLNYWDSHHYRRHVGDGILNVILSDSQTSPSLDWPSAPLTQKNIEYSLQKTRKDQLRWRSQNQSTFQWIQNLKKLHYSSQSSN